MPAPAIISQLQAYVATDAFRQRYSQRVRDAIDRLVTHEDMRPIWEQLGRNPENDLSYSFLDSSAHALWREERMPSETDTKIRRNLKNLAKAAQSLANDLDEHADELAFSEIRVKIEGYAVAPSLAAQDPRPYYDQVHGPASLQSLLREFALRAAADPEPRLPLTRPRKRGDPSAGRTYLVKETAEFFLTHGGSVHWDWVARAVSAMTNTQDLDASFAKKLFGNIRDIDSDSASDDRPRRDE